MSEAEQFAELISLVDSDPFALIGVSVSADEKRIAKRYRQIAKHLHPDILASQTSESGLSAAIAAKIIAHIVNPAYQKLKQERSRQEILATIRLRVRRLVRTEKLVPTFSSAQQLSTVDDSSVDTYYEQALTHIASHQFQSWGAMHTHSLEISQLNLIYLSRKLEDLIIRPKRAGLMKPAVTPTAVASTPGVTTAQTAVDIADSEDETKQPEIDYVRKHTARAKTYLVKQNYEMAVQELREALKIAPQDPELHSMIGQSYYKQKLSGMAKSHFRQALKLKPTHKVALKYSKLLGLSEENHSYKASKSSAVPQSHPAPAEVQKKAWLGRLLSR